MFGNSELDIGQDMKWNRRNFIGQEKRRLPRLRIEKTAFSDNKKRDCWQMSIIRFPVRCFYQIRYAFIWNERRKGPTFAMSKDKKSSKQNNNNKKIRQL